ncbi:MSHA biogenesis protein MshQ [Vibrio anguillarum]|uniref:MSHA biogenesis protein MshQ n=5 Tax=Vibrionaceae TaxID=641 RepID=A0A289G948_VIBAN|nr:MSHA biogenesis protein MshQ [Vibrio anguillarum]AXN04829.1 MSHA biogenesis protein MshQ [Vibrio anguillarum]AZS25232.1 MSHA biogenesis protein MshQ [Vibrio anguillarum]MBF4310317.1 MSHA biogenesis protein MshQ [Vibrio anguillarum]MBF4326369.1 MSHA biogenesis protein MshQ [Vibrio anguillarum]
MIHYKWLISILLSTILSISATSVMAFQQIDNSIYFPHVAQGQGSCASSPNPQLIQYGYSQITGTAGDPLAFCSINNISERQNARCDDQFCQVTGGGVASLSLSGGNAFKNSSNNNNQINWCYSGQSIVLNQSNIGKLQLYDSCTLQFSGLSEYKIKSLDMGSSATLVLSSGDYWIETLQLNSNAIVEVEGDVRLFIKNSSSWNSSDINISGAGNLTIVGFNNLSLNGNTQVNGYVYIGNTLALNNSATINGRTTSRRLMMEGNTQINQNEQQGYACFEDDFNRSSLGQNWIPYTSTGSFTPSLISNRLRLTEDQNNQATAVTYQRIFPAAGNLVTVEFDYYAWANLTGDGADGVSIIFSDAEIIPRTGGFGGSLGYAPTTSSNPIKPGFAGGWLGVGLDEWGNYSNPTEGRVGGPGFRRQAVAIRGSEAASYRYLVGTAANLNPKLDVRRTCQWWGGNCSFPGPGPGHRYFITIDSRNNNAVYVRVDRLVNGNMQTVIDWFNVLSNPNQGATPEEFLLSLAGSTGASVNNHEIENFKVCALKSRDVGEQVDHFRFTLPSSDGLTCNAADVQIQACANSSCSELYQQPITATLLPNSLPSAGGGWQGGSQVNMTNGIANLKLRKNSAGNVTVGVQSSVPSAKPFSTNLCRYGSGGYSAQNCTLNFVDSGFILDVPNSYANQSVTGTIKAVRKDNASQLCLPSFKNVQKPVSFWSDYLSPNGGQGFRALSVGVNSVAVGPSSNTAAPVVLNFNQNGEASINVSYREAGSLALNARLTGSGDEQDLQLTGQTTFIRVPRALVLSATSYYGVSGACPNADISCDIFARADENFNLNIKAVAEAPIEDNDFTNNLVVTNYQQANIELKHTLIAPATGVPGALGEVEYDHQLGSSTTVQQRVSEVGVFDFSLNAPTTYLGLDLASENLPIAVASTGPIGRFIPAYFSPSSVVTSLQAECEVTSPNDESFSYLGQPFGYKDNPGIYLHPRSASGSETINYFDSAWWRYDRQWDNRIYNDTVNSLPISFDSDLTSVNRVNGVDSRVELFGEELIYQKPSQPIVPFNSNLDLILLASDLTDLDGVCYRATASDPCLDYTITDIDEEMKLRWGKLVIHDTYGPETSGLSQPVTSEYFTSNGFVTNNFDRCTLLPALANFTLTPTDLTLGSAGAPEVDSTLVSQTLTLGTANINFTAPGAGHQGFIDTLLDLNAHGLPWLRLYNDQNSAFENEVSGRVQFGLYRGSDRVIWWREKN